MVVRLHRQIPNAYGSLMSQAGGVGLNASTSHDSTREAPPLPLLPRARSARAVTVACRTALRVVSAHANGRGVRRSHLLRTSLGNWPKQGALDLVLQRHLPESVQRPMRPRRAPLTPRARRPHPFVLLIHERGTLILLIMHRVRAELRALLPLPSLAGSVEAVKNAHDSLGTAVCVPRAVVVVVVDITMKRVLGL